MGHCFSALSMGNPIQYRMRGNPIQIPWLIFHSNRGLIQQDVRCWLLIIDGIWLAISSHKQSKWSVYKDWVQVFIWIFIIWKQIWNTTFFNRCCVDRSTAAVGSSWSPIYCAVSKSLHVVIYYRGLCTKIMELYLAPTQSLPSNMLLAPELSPVSFYSSPNKAVSNYSLPWLSCH